MYSISIVCDRCKKIVKGINTSIATSGYYSTGSNSMWAKFASPDENAVCEECMWKDERYIAVYGKMGL
jgi:hypothetical protein